MYGPPHDCKGKVEGEKGNPNYAWGHAFWSQWLFIMGRHEEAIIEAQLG